MTMKCRRFAAACSTLILCALSLHLAAAQQAKAPDAQQGLDAWTLEEARAHLRLYPRDAYVQYVALQLARREGNLAEVAAELQQRDPLRNAWDQRRDQVDLFSIFSGQLAVQESLQLDAFAPDSANDLNAPVDAPSGRGGPRPIGAAGGANAAASRDSVPIASLEGPSVKSHPWEEMLAGRKPEVKGLALVAPADFYFVSFESLNKLLDAADLATLWGAHVLNQANREAKTQLVGDRLREQLAVEETPELRPFYDAVVDEVAIVGSDLFVREGSDVTMLFHAQQPPLLRAKMDQFLAKAENSRDDAVRSEGTYQGVDYVHVTTPDRRVHVYSAYPKDDLHVRSNSLKALERVLAAISGKDADGKAVERLGETDEFRYVRTILKPGAEEEDGLVYLSDPFVRRLMSAEVRLTQRRRQSCYNNLRMIGHAGLMHRTETGHDAGSLEELNASDCAAGKFGEGKFACPEHGEYTLGADGVTGVCSHHGYASYLTPCVDVPTEKVSQKEADAYKAFVDQYNQYWRRFFDPIAIRLQITPEKLRAETVVLPLIDNTVYSGLAMALGGEPEALDALPVPKRNIFSVAVRLNKAELLTNFGLEEFIPLDDPGSELARERAMNERAASLFARAFWAMNGYQSSHEGFPAARKGGLSWRVELLPYMGEQELYKEFHLDEPWDSPHNKKLIARMPTAYQSENDDLNAAGKTRVVVPRGAGTMFADEDKGTAVDNGDIRLQNTIVLLEADDEHAVVWTKPEDLELDAKDAAQDLQIRKPGGFLVAFGGHMQFLRQEIPEEALAAALSRDPDDGSPWQEHALPMPQVRTSGGWRDDQDREAFEQLRPGELIVHGIGNQIGFHVYDSDPLFDLGMARFLGMSIGQMRGTRMLNDDFLFLFPLVGALNGPVYVTIPVQDRAIVDGFLDRLDTCLAQLATREERGFFFSVDQDFYHLPAKNGREVRAYGLGFGPLKWRFFWSRIDDAVYIASKREVLDDIAALAAQQEDNTLAGSPRDPGGADDKAHALVRIRPQNWDRVLSAYRLGWEENNREACLRNLGPLSGLSRAIAAGRPGEPVTVGELDQYTARVYDVHHFCPDGGHYETDADGHAVTCSVHGSASDPRQGEAPAASSELGALIRQFSDMRITLTFLEDGLHAVATLERKAGDEAK